MARQRFVPKKIGEDSEETKSSVFREVPSRRVESRFTRYHLHGDQTQDPNPETAVNLPEEDIFIPTPSANDINPEIGPSLGQTSSAAELELQNRFEQAAKEGFEAGLAQAEATVQAALDQQLAKVEGLLRAILQLRGQVIDEYQEQCIRLAIAGAEGLARRTFEQDQNIVRELIKQALAELRGVDTITLTVDEESAPALREWINERFDDLSVRVVGQEELSAHDFRAQSNLGSITCYFDERIERLRQSILFHRGLDEFDLEQSNDPKPQ